MTAVQLRSARVLLFGIARCCTVGAPRRRRKLCEVAFAGLPKRVSSVGLIASASQAASGRAIRVAAVRTSSRTFYRACFHFCCALDLRHIQSTKSYPKLKLQIAQNMKDASMRAGARLVLLCIALLQSARLGAGRALASTDVKQLQCFKSFGPPDATTAKLLSFPRQLPDGTTPVCASYQLDCSRCVCRVRDRCGRWCAAQ